MAAISCPHCAELKQRVAELEAIVRQQPAAICELLAKLGQNASNSSTPPSASPLHAPKPALIGFVPEQCPHGHAPLPAAAGPHDAAPTRWRVIELPPVVAEVTE